MKISKLKFINRVIKLFLSTYLWMILCGGLSYANINNKIYAHEYSNAILNGVSVSDVYTFNAKNTTTYGPSYADIVTTSSNFLQCMPPSGRKFSYALCYYSGPDEPTGNNPENPPLPCKLSDDGVYANCSCYEISTDIVSPKMPYLVDINAISNLTVYQETIKACGKNGEKCADGAITPPVCEAINTNLLVPGADLISVFSPIYTEDYINKDAGTPLTSCTGNDAGIYAGCMTAPCYRTGEKDANGNNIVECKCPIFNGPYQIGQADQNCNANKVVSSNITTTNDYSLLNLKNNNVWSAAYNVTNSDNQGCIPDMPSEKGCGLYNSESNYEEIINPKGKLCQNVCSAYGNNLTSDGTQVAYSCDATMCTTVGIGQEHNPLFPPAKTTQINLLSQSCSSIEDISTLQQIMLVEELAKCSCCASQVCQCDNINQKTNQMISNLNQQQRQAGIQPQCDINQTLCGDS
ncbi:hypothetical protein L3V82_06065 [Thiotrichales bacterium 19S3-7]|nr:hypothetical protein [Thiotrichales bacterium 19S3-7]MCF6801660.1 hypothetical protein [Thiotrichales bacterium 19S3-11]